MQALSRKLKPGLPMLEEYDHIGAAQKRFCTQDIH
jgi:hypothetical protein